jgi:hypothetical protein
MRVFQDHTVCLAEVLLDNLDNLDNLDIVNGSHIVVVEKVAKAWVEWAHLKADLEDVEEQERAAIVAHAGRACH